MLKKRVVAAVAAALVAGGASAVGVNPGGKGEQLIAPMVMVAGGFETEIRLVNTDTVNSTVVKLTFHEHKYSEEVLDFYVFLSPGDVWRGTAKAQPHGTAGMNRLGVASDDDSSLYVPSQGNNCPQAKADSVGFDPAKMISTEKRLGGNGLEAGQPVDSSFTYLTVVESTTVTGLGVAPVDKAKILAAYANYCVNQATPASLVAAVPGVAGKVVGTRLVPTHMNAITGDVTVRNSVSGTQMGLPMTAIDNVRGSRYQLVGIYSSLGSFGETSSQVDPITGAPLSSATKTQVEDALWSTAYALPYNLEGVNSTFATVTFPTKDTWLPNGLATSQYFSRLTNKLTPSVFLEARNEKEETIATAGCYKSPCAVSATNSMPWELNVLAFTKASGATNAGLVSTSGFERGWAMMKLEELVSTDQAAANYNNAGDSGSPALVTTISWQMRPDGGFNGSWAYASKTQQPSN